MHNSAECFDRTCRHPLCLELKLWAHLLEQQYLITRLSGPEKTRLLIYHDSLVEKYSRVFPYLIKWRLVPAYRPPPDSEWPFQDMF